MADVANRTDTKPKEPTSLTLRERTLELLVHKSGATDREITDLVTGYGSPQQPINQLCRQLERSGALVRCRREDGLIGNYLRDPDVQRSQARTTPSKPSADGLSEDDVKRHLVRWLENQGWSVTVAWAKARGIDVEAVKAGNRWIIEAKGCGSLQPMRVNYFVGVLGELLQRMTDPSACYSVALPDMAQFRGLWNRLPQTAKQRTGISVLFVGTDGTVSSES